VKIVAKIAELFFKSQKVQFFLWHLILCKRELSEDEKKVKIFLGQKMLCKLVALF